MNNSIITQVEQSPPKSFANLSKKEKSALNELSKRDNVIFCNADKGGAVVIWDVIDYIKEAMKLLNDRSFYKILPNNPTSTHCELINNTIETFKQNKQLEKKLAEGLKAVEPRTPQFYLLPKIHKANIPGRPVVSSINSHTTKSSEFVDYYLQPFVKSLRSYVQDTTHFINKIESVSKHLPQRAILVTMDVKSLYTNIPNHEGITAVKSFLDTSAIKHLTPIITTFLRLILTLNNFIFNDTNFLKTNGIAMGTKCAPSYANLFMGKFEETFILPKLLNKCPLYLRYIDDIFFIWENSEAELKSFIDEINQVHPTIKFDVKFSYKEISFLDTTVKITPNNKLATTLYKKPTDKQSFLHHKSYHPASTKKSIPFSQALRLSRICSDENDYMNQLEELKSKFTQRGYPCEDITSQFNKASNIDRKETHIYKEKSNKKCLVFSTTFNKNLPNTRQCFDENWHLLSINPVISKVFKEKPVVAHRRNDNLRKLIGQNKVSGNKKILLHTTKDRTLQTM